MCCDPKLAGKETVSLTPHPSGVCCLGGQEVLLETSYFVIVVVCFCFPVLGAEAGLLISHSLLSNTPN